jgi:hypothetical protein
MKFKSITSKVSISWIPKGTQKIISSNKSLSKILAEFSFSCSSLGREV